MGQIIYKQLVLFFLIILNITRSTWSDESPSSSPDFGSLTSWYDCVPGIQDSIGVTIPKGDIFAGVGSEPIELFCHINPSHVYYKEKGYNSSKLFFEISGRGKYQSLFEEIKLLDQEIVNSTTLKGVFDPKTVGYFDVWCKLKVFKRDEIKRSDQSDETEDATTTREYVDNDDNTVAEKGVCRQLIGVGCK